MKVLSEKPISISELYSIIKKIEERDKELDYRSERVKKFIEKLEILKEEDAKKLKEELREMGLKEKQIVKIADFLPESNDDLRAILYGEITDQELLKKILDIVKKYK